VAAVVIPMQLVARTPATQKQTAVSWDRSGQHEVYVAEIDQATGKVVKWQEFQKKDVAVDKSGPSFDLQMFFKTFFGKQSEKTFAVAEKSLKKLDDEQSKGKLAAKLSNKELIVKQVKVAAAQNLAAEEQKAKELDRGRLEKLKLIEALAQEERAASEQQSIDDLRRKVAEMQRRLERSALEEQAADEAKRRDMKLIEARRQAERAAETLRRGQTPTSDVLITRLRELSREQEILNEQLQEMTRRHETLRAQQQQLVEELERLRRATPRE
jgi:hypothetical protein